MDNIAIINVKIIEYKLTEIPKYKIMIKNTFNPIILLTIIINASNEFKNFFQV